MSEYGFTSFTPNGEIQFDSRRESYQGYNVHSFGSQTGVVTITGTRDDDLIFAKCNPAAGEKALLVQYFSPWYATRSGYQDLLPNRTYLDTDKTGVVIDYVVLRKSETLSSSSGDYGLQVFSSDSTTSNPVVQYDTRALSGQGSFKIKNIWLPHSMDGNGTNVAGNSTLLLYSNAYVSSQSNFTFDEYFLMNPTYGVYESQAPAMVNGKRAQHFADQVDGLYSQLYAAYNFLNQYNDPDDTIGADRTAVQYAGQVNVVIDMFGSVSNQIFYRPNVSPIISGVKI